MFTSLGQINHIALLLDRGVPCFERRDDLGCCNEGIHGLEQDPLGRDVKLACTYRVLSLSYIVLGRFKGLFLHYLMWLDADGLAARDGVLKLAGKF